MSFRELLGHELRRRQANNHRYSLRAFARALQVDPSTLSKILRGKRELSMTTAFKIASCLELSGERVTEFLSSVAQSAREFRERRRSEINRLNSGPSGN